MIATTGDIVYRKPKSGGYKLLEDWGCQTGMKEQAARIEGVVELAQDGWLTVYKGYLWDGPSGPTLDTKNSMRGALAHDALYQLTRERKLPLTARKPADALARELWREDGMWFFRRWGWYWTLRWFGRGSAKPQPDATQVIHKAP